MIMGDMLDALGFILAPDRDDYNILTAIEKASNNTSRMTYTDQDRKCFITTKVQLVP